MSEIPGYVIVDAKKSYDAASAIITSLDKKRELNAIKYGEHLRQTITDYQNLNWFMKTFIVKCVYSTEKEVLEAVERRHKWNINNLFKDKYTAMTSIKAAAKCAMEDGGNTIILSANFAYIFESMY